MAGEDKLRDYLKRVTVDLAETRRKLAEADARRTEPIAIVGMACRYPGADSVDAFWESLAAGQCAVADDVPGGRYDLSPYEEACGVYTRRGAFLRDIAGWDARFFGATAREALRMDPQQRLLMELFWEAMEDAGMPPASLEGSRTGVLVGFSDPFQYGRVQSDQEGTAFMVDPYTGQGSSMSVAAGRLAYHFDLRGPTMALDTACSSSLVAVHQAGEALRRGECDLALAAAAFLVIHPDMYVNGCSTSMFAPDGLCKTFDARADGYVIGEGGGVVMLERLSDALRSGRRIHAVIRGSAVNQDGRSNGLTAPNRSAQVDVIRRALSAARATADEVVYVEAHGSATKLGDAIELGALGDVFGTRSPDRPLHVGAVKSNIGHTQAAAGMAGLIKTVLVLERGVVPPNVNLTELSETALAAGEIRPVTATVPLPVSDGPRFVGVSSFGWSGTNAHVVMEAAPAPESAAHDGASEQGRGAEQAETPQPGRAKQQAGSRLELLPVSAADPAALREYLSRLAASVSALEDGDGESALADIARTLQSGRAEHEYRRAIVAANITEAAARFADASTVSAVRRPKDAPSVAFLIPDAADGNPALGVDLYREDAAFAEVADECVALAAEHLDVDLRPHFTGASVAGAEVARLLVFVVEYALARALERRGVTPQQVTGAGVGALVAACLNGEQGLEDAMRAVVEGAEGATVAPVNTADVCIELGAGRSESHPEQGPVVLYALGDGAGSEMAAVLETYGRLWELGVTLDWDALRGDRGRITGLPTYPFQRQRFWPELAAKDYETAPVTDRVELLARRWTKASAATASAQFVGTALLLATEGDIADALAERLRADNADVIIARPDEQVSEPTGPVTVVYLASVDERDELQAVVSASQALAHWGSRSTQNTRVLVVTRGGHEVRDGEPANPAQAAVAALPIVAAQEYLSLDVRGIDLDPAFAATEAAAALSGELRAPTTEVLVAYRDGIRHVPGYTPAPVDDDPQTSPVVLSGGTYLITGGLGDIGLTLAEHLVRSGAGALVLTSRGGVSDDPADPRHVAVERLRGLGAEVHTPRVDVTDADAMRALFAEHRMDGVVHAAAQTDPGSFRSLADADEGSVSSHLRTKVGGAQVLADVLAELTDDRAPRWCHVFSSTSALLGGVTFGAYAAANAALAAVASQTRGGAVRWIAVAWDTWACTLDRLAGGAVGASLVAHSMSDQEALAAFDLSIAGGYPSVVIAAGGLEDRLPRARTNATTEVSTVALVAPGSRFARPELPQPYTPPVTDTEREMVELWAGVLGVEPVGTRDNFFDLGGTSLLIPQLLGLVKQQFGVALPTVTVFEAPTVRALGALVDGENEPEPEQQYVPQVTVSAAVSTPTPTREALVSAQLERAQPASADLVPAVRVTSEPAPAVPQPELDRRIAIVGMAGRFPGAGDVGAFWRNLCEGVESITFFEPQELIDAGVEPEVVNHPAYVPARAVLDDVAGFDAGFFGISPRMAALTDPQQRLFLEVCWEALEQAGYCRPEHRGRVGVYGGTHISTYLLGIRDRLGDDVSQFEVAMGNEKDALATTVSYLFDLHGPSVAVQTFCSTSLVATHLAVRALRGGECEMALAGGVSIRVPEKRGHIYEEGGMESPDGHVRTFDAKARGAMFGDGAAVVMLKRLSDALRDGDHIWGVIRGTAMNNDGGLKVGYTAPSVVGQAKVVAEAMVDAGVRAEQVGYVEAHGSGTPLGDPIEVAALTRAFGRTPERQYCPIGSVKTNVGHLDRAAGATGLIKTAMVVREGVIPPTLHFTTPNPDIDFAGSPFYVNNRLQPWAANDGQPRIAGLNSLGMGGTNVHVVVEEPPRRLAGPPADPTTSRRYQVLPVSARSEAAAEDSCRRLGDHLAANPGTRLADVAYTLQVGRKTFEHRRAAVVSGIDDAVAVLTRANGSAPSARVEAAQERPVAFLLAGVGEQYPGLVGELYRREPAFRARLDDCIARIAEALSAEGVDASDGAALIDLVAGQRGGGTGLAALLGRATAADPRAEALQRTEIVQPLMFAVDYALAATLIEWGLRPSAMLGYSLGEYVAATLAGVLSLGDAIALVVHRAALISGEERGAMAAVSSSAKDLRTRFRLDERGLDIAAINGPATVVVAGHSDAVAELLEELRQAEIACRPLQTTHAFHSRMLASVAAPLTEWIAANISLNPPKLPYLSNVTGEMASPALVRDPAYWARHMCETVQFAAGADVLLADPSVALVEIGPGPSLGALIRAAGCPPERWPLITATLPAGTDPRAADETLADCLARLWLLGAEIDWTAYHGRREGAADVYQGVAPGRIPLPTYPFQRQKYWIEPSAPALPSGSSTPALSAGTPENPTALTDVGRVPRLPEEQWLHMPVWRQLPAARAAEQQPGSWLVFSRDGAADRVLDELRRAAASTGASVTVVRPGEAYQAGTDGYALRPGSVDDALSLLRDVRAGVGRPERVVHLWTLDEPTATQTAAIAAAAREEGSPEYDDAATVALGLHTLVALARAAGELGMDGWALDIVTAGAHDVLGSGDARPEAATLVGPALVIPLEYPSVSTRLIDAEARTDAAAIVAELRRPTAERTVALRGSRRWACDYESIATPELPADQGDIADVPLRENGVYLITGGLGGIGLGMATHLASACRAKLVLFSRSGLPPRERWEAIESGAEEVDESTRGRVARALEIIQLGGELEIVVGDISDPDDARRAIERAHARFGTLHGVLHAAGVPGIGLIQFKRPEDGELVLAPKVAGTRALARALRLGESDEVALDFLVLFSSVTSATGGGPGQVDYCAANAFLGAFAAAWARPDRRVLAVDWGEWVWNAWDDGLSGFDDGLGAFFREHRAAFGIAFDEGWRTLQRALASGETRVFASTQDFSAMVRLSAGFTVDAVLAPAGQGSGGKALERHPRPELMTPYQEPSGPTEEAIAALWADSLKLDRIGALDNFFELGGNSLLGINLLGSLRRVFTDAELPPHILHQAPTVAALAEIVDAGSRGSAGAAETSSRDDDTARDEDAQAQLRRSALKAAAARRRKR